jgi:hypothetical protein
LREFFGDDMIKNILATHEEDMKFFADKTLEEEVNFLLEKY